MMKIAYITTSFGSLSHTFIRREVFELQRLGIDVLPFGIHPDISSKLNGEELTLARKTVYLYPLRPLQILSANLWFMRYKYANYFLTFSGAILNNESKIFNRLKMIYHFFISPYIALRMRKKEVDHIHAHFLHVPSTIAMYCSGLLGIRFSISVQSSAITEEKGMIGIKQKLVKAAFIRVVSNDILAQLNNVYPCAQKVHLVHDGIDIDEYSNEKNRYPDRSENRTMLVSVGRFIEVKGFKYVVDAVKLLSDEEIDVSLSIIGCGPLDRELRQSVNSYGLNNRVIFKGSFSPEDVIRELKKNDIVIVPSVTTKDREREGIPNVIVEAMVAGLFVIATRHAGIPEIVIDRQTGLLVPERDARAIAGAIKEVMKDAALKQACINNARRLVKDQFNIHSIARTMKELFERYP